MFEDYKKLDLKRPVESEDYIECSRYIIDSIKLIIKEAIDKGNNKIVINTNLKLGIPMENVNKIAGPFVEAWAQEIFFDVLQDEKNKYQLINVETCERLNMADILLQFRRTRKHQTSVTANVDVKATSQDIESSGRSPNITSFARIRSAYVEDPDYIFVILSLKHSVYSTRDEVNSMMMGVMEVVDYNVYDLKHLSLKDISYNPALGTGQLQIRDIHYVTEEIRTTWQFCELLDRKCIASKKGYKIWLEYARSNKWIK